MLRWFIGRKLATAEAETGESLDYLRHVLRYSLGGFRAFAKIMPAVQYRQTVPAAPYYVAKLVAARSEDCGPCVQTVINLAKKELVPTRILQAALSARPDELPEECAEAYRFAEAVARQSGDEAAHRDSIRRRYGEAGVIELSLAVAMARVFPTLKRGLGYAKSCSLVTVET